MKAIPEWVLDRLVSEGLTITYKIRKTLKELGGHWNKFATGWMFPRNMRHKLEEQIAKHA